jgi:hypothetical protein
MNGLPKFVCHNSAMVGADPRSGKARKPQVPLGRWLWRLHLLLAVVAFLLVQTAAATEFHSDDHGHADGHCCAACHGGHFPVIEPGALVPDLMPALVNACHAMQQAERPRSADTGVVNSSRAPPLV